MTLAWTPPPPSEDVDKEHFSSVTPSSPLQALFGSESIRLSGADAAALLRLAAAALLLPAGRGGLDSVQGSAECGEMAVLHLLTSRPNTREDQEPDKEEKGQQEAEDLRKNSEERNCFFFMSLAAVSER